MECREEPDGTLVLTYDSKAWGRFFFVLAAVMPATAAYDHFIGTRGEDRLIGLVGGFVTLALAGLVFFEQAHVVIDPAARTIVWKRRWGFSRRSGSLAFDQVASVLPERPIGDNGVPSRRIVLRTKSGESVPLTVGYKPDGGRGDPARVGTNRCAAGARHGHAAAGYRPGAGGRGAHHGRDRPPA